MENREEIVKRLKLLLMATRAGSGIADLVLDGQKVTILFKSGYRRDVNIAADSGVAVIMDVIKNL